MSSPPPDLPKDPAEYRRKPLLGLGFWLVIAFGALFILVGIGVAVLGPRLFPTAPEPPAAPPPAAATQPVVEPAPKLLSVEVAPSSDEVARLNARIAALETEGARATEAAAAALAAAQLMEAAQGSRPFGRELAALRAAAPNLPELAALSRLAELGAPSRTTLAVTFPAYAARAASRARKPAEGAGLGERIAYAATKVVNVRRVDETAGSSSDARLARAELALSEGEVAIALKALDGLPTKAGDALAPWRAGAERRAEVDREVAALRQRAILALSQQDRPT